MDTIRQDVRYALRMLWKHRFATFICAGALALGMGANTAIFSMAEGFLMHPVPLEHVDRMVALVDFQPQHGFAPMNISPATYLEWKQQAQSFAWAGIFLLKKASREKITNSFSAMDCGSGAMVPIPKFLAGL